MPVRLRILIADDNGEWCRIISVAVEGECDVVGCVESGDQIVETAVEMRPDVVTVDISMPVRSGLQALPGLRAALPEAVLIVVSTTDSALYREEARRLGADGYVAKRRVELDLMEVIRRGRVAA